MDDTMDTVNERYIGQPSERIVSHGRWPVKKLVEGQIIRFRSQSYEREVVMRIEKLRWFDKMVIVSGPELRDVALGLNEYVELVTVDEH